MRRISLLMILASCAAPVLAAPDDYRGDRAKRIADSERSDSQQPTSEPIGPRDPSQSEPRQFNIHRSERSQPSEQGTSERIRDRILHRQQSATTQADGTVPAREWRRRAGPNEAAAGQATLLPRERQIRTIPDTQPQVTQSGREVARSFEDRSRPDYRDGHYERWSNEWRYNRIYDWRDHRSRHRSLFRLGRYYDPFGWSYRRWSTGAFLYPSYYGSGFWLDDPWAYRLPPAYGPYRWVRYWNDALLVNVHTGQVIDVVRNFFW